MDVALDKRIGYRREDIEGESMWKNARWLEADPEVLVEWAARVLAAAIAEQGKRDAS